MAPSRGSMMVLLGALALAGYQNRDKLGAMLGGLGQGANGPGLGNSGQQGGLGGLLGSLGGAFGGGSTGGVLSGGLNDLIDRFREKGQEETARSWVGTGANRELAPNDLQQAIGEDTIADLSRHTGLSREELLSRLSRDLPKAVDQWTPEGRIPDEAEADRLYSGGGSKLDRPHA